MGAFVAVRGAEEMQFPQQNIGSSLFKMVSDKPMIPRCKKIYIFLLYILFFFPQYDNSIMMFLNV